MLLFVRCVQTGIFTRRQIHIWRGVGCLSSHVKEFGSVLLARMSNASMVTGVTMYWVPLWETVPVSWAMMGGVIVIQVCEYVCVRCVVFECGGAHAGSGGGASEVDLGLVYEFCKCIW